MSEKRLWWEAGWLVGTEMNKILLHSDFILPDDCDPIDYGCILEAVWSIREGLA